MLNEIVAIFPTFTIFDDYLKVTLCFRFGSCSESGQSSVEFEDALDIPYQRLEEFADVLASKVLINSVAITRREYMCSLRVSIGISLLPPESLLKHTLFSIGRYTVFARLYDGSLVVE